MSDISKEEMAKTFFDEKMIENDPEFTDLFTNFAFDEVVNQIDLDEKTRYMAILAALLGCQ